MAHSPSQDWIRTVEEQLKEGKKQFADIIKKLDDNTTTTKDVSAKIEANTRETREISKKLGAHIESYDKFRIEAQPAMDAIMTMQAGVRIIGKIGTGIAWLGQRFRKMIVWIAPIFMFFAAVWAFFHDNTTALWKAILEFFK